MITRFLKKQIQNDLKNKMVFLGGPRQVGKTTLSLEFTETKKKSDEAYLNWDVAKSRKIILNQEYPTNKKLIIFDEIHKYSRWKNYMKGFYDEHYPTKNALVTGSARLNIYKKGGDSLLGRYHYLRLHPLSLLELSQNPNSNDLHSLIEFGGFPEPFFNQSEAFHRRWHNERLERLIREDLRDLEKVKDLSLLEILAEALPDRVGSPLSLKSLQEDLQVSHDSIRAWVEIFDHLYYSFRIAPFGSPMIRAVKKEQKLYLWDWSQIKNKGFRFENFVASQLLRYCHYLTDVLGYKAELRFIRDTDGREIDFVVIKDKKPIFAVECKTGENQLSERIQYFKKRTNIPIFYQVHLGTKDYSLDSDSIRVLPMLKFIKEIIEN